jgi:putative hydrolase
MADPSDNEPLDVPLGDIMGDAPLLREIQRVMLASSGPVNWELARQIGVATASWDGDDPPPTDEDREGLIETVRAAELAVADFTGLAGPANVAPVEAYRRAQWVEANTRSLREILDPVAARMTSAMRAQAASAGGSGFIPGFTGGPPEDALQGEPGAEMLQALMGQMVPLLMGAQVGTVLGFLGQRVLAQFDLAVPRPSGGGLYFVIPNIARLERDWSLSPMEFRAWVALHEVTHRFEFASPWVRPHFSNLVRQLVEHAEVDLSGLEQRLEGMDLSSAEALADAFEGMGNVFGQAATAEQRLRLARVQAFMAAAEGYSDHVMEVVGGRMLASYGQIEEAIRRHRDGRYSDRAMERLLGLEMKDEQYVVGRAFCSRVVEQTDEATLAQMWESAEALPSMPELEEPTLWLSRMA